MQYVRVETCDSALPPDSDVSKYSGDLIPDVYNVFSCVFDMSTINVLSHAARSQH